MIGACLAVSTTAFSLSRANALPLLARGAIGASVVSNSRRSNSQNSQTVCKMSSATEFVQQEIAKNDVSMNISIDYTCCVIILHGRRNVKSKNHSLFFPNKLLSKCSSTVVCTFLCWIWNNYLFVCVCVLC